MDSEQKFASAQKAVKDMVADHLIPIVVGVNGRPGSIGTGLPLDLGTHKVVVTAAHVVADADEESIHMAISGSPEDLAGVQSVSRKRCTPGNSDDYIDVAVLELTEFGIDQISQHRRWLPLSRLERDDNRTYDTHMVLIGCPEQLASNLEQLRFLAVQPMALFTRTYARSEYIPSHKPAIHVVAHYPGAGNFRLSDGASVPFTRPHGFSGGPIFRTALEDSGTFWTPENCTLIGLDQSWTESSQSIKLVRSNVVLAMLKFWFPDLSF